MFVIINTAQTHWDCLNKKINQKNYHFIQTGSFNLADLI